MNPHRARQIRDYNRDLDRYDPEASEVDPRQRFDDIVQRIRELPDYRPIKPDDGISHGYVDVRIGRTANDSLALSMHVGYTVIDGVEVPQEVDATWRDPTDSHGRLLDIPEKVERPQLVESDPDPQTLRQLGLLEESILSAETQRLGDGSAAAPTP